MEVFLECVLCITHLDLLFSYVGFWRCPTVPGSAPVFNDAWLEHKVLHSAGKESFEPISYSASRESTFKVLTRQRISCAHITSAGRRGGAVEGSRLGILRGPVRDDCCRTRGAQKEHELRLHGLSSRFALGMAGFQRGTFHLVRNQEWPSLDLQRQVFSFIETALYSDDWERRQQWVKECTRVMMDQSPTNDEEPFINNCQHSSGGRASGSLSTPQHQFLLMLVRMRSILLQDAAAYIALFNIAKGNGRPHPEAGFESVNPVLKRDVFKSEAFIAFQRRVEEAITRPEEPLPKGWTPEVVECMRNLNRTMASVVRSVRDQQERLFRQQPQDVAGFLTARTEFHRQPAWQQPYPQQPHQAYPQQPQGPKEPYPQQPQQSQQPQQPQQPQRLHRVDSQQNAETVAGGITLGSFSAFMSHPSQPLALQGASPLAPRPILPFTGQPTAQSENSLTMVLQRQDQMQRQLQPSQTPSQSRAVETPQFPLLKEGDFSKDRPTSIQQIINEHNQFVQFKERYKRHRQDCKVMKTLNNRARIVEEVKVIMDGPPRRTRAEAVEELSNVLVPNSVGELEHWKSINRLFKHCQAKKTERNGAREREGSVVAT